MSLRILCIHIIIALLWLASPLLSSRSVAKEIIAVFLPSFQSNFAIKQQLENACFDYNFDLYGHFNDYLKSISNTAPTAIITLNHQALVPAQFQLKAETSSTPGSLQLVMARFESLDKAIRTLGIANYYGRENTIQFAREFLGEHQRIRITNRIEDLLPLMQFSRADAIVATRPEIEKLQSRTQQKVVIKPLDVQKAAAVIAVQRTTDRPIVNQLVACTARFQLAAL